jgi:hypothetical protein
VVATLLGNVVTVQVRGVDYVSITERAQELVTLRAFGCPEVGPLR